LSRKTGMAWIEVICRLPVTGREIQRSKSFVS
jgi:hypothetical protein